MHLLPFDKYQIHTSKSPESVLYIMSQNVGERSRAFCRTEVSFYGKLDPDSFRLLPNNEIRNSFRPVILGRFSATESGTVIDVISRMRLFALVLMLLWITGAFYTMIGGLLILLDGEGPLVLIFGLVFICVGWLVSTGFYWDEETKAKSTLHSLLADN